MTSGGQGIHDGMYGFIGREERLTGVWLNGRTPGQQYAHADRLNCQDQKKEKKKSQQKKIPPAYHHWVH
jgi:hypothetical protein